MKVPDKVYLDIIEDDDIHMIAPSFKDNDGVEYIRKDTLLEWAKECFRLQDKGSWYSKGAADAFSEVINKLNEMCYDTGR